MDAHRIPTRGAIGFGWGAVILLVAVVSAHAASPGARLVSATGTVEILNAPAGQWVAATSPAVLPPGSALRTGPESKVVLELDGAVVTLYDTSLIRIPTAAAPASTSGNPLRHPLLDSGRALFDVTPRTDRAPFSVRTPTILAGVKGTAFEVVATATQQAVYVWRGLVEVASLVDRADVQLVSAGQFTMLDHLQLTPPTDIPNDREEPAGLDSHPETTVTTARVDASATDSIIGLWLKADSVALQGALDDARDFQTVVSTGGLRTVSTLTSTTDTVDSTLDSTTSTLSSTTETLVTDPLSGTVSTVTTTVDSTLDSTTSALSATLEPIVTDTSTSLVSTVSSPLGLLGF